MSVQVHSVWYGDQIAAAVVRKAPQASRSAAEQLLKATIPRVPVRTGALRSSGHVVDAAGDASAVVFDTDYAVYVHELLRNYHPVGEAKFLENALNEERNELMRVMVDHMREAMGR